MKNVPINFAPILIFLFFSPFGLGQGDFEKGISYYKQGQYEKAIQEFEQIVQASPDYEAGYRVLGDSYLKLKQYRKAATAFRRAIDLEGERFASHLGAAVAEFNLEQYQDTIATLLRAEKYAVAPREKYQLFSLRGAAYYNLGRFRETVRDLSQAVSIQRGQPSDLLQLGIAHYQLEEYSEAKRFLEQASSFSSTSQQAGRYLSRLSFQEALAAIEAEDFRRATSLLRTYVERNPRDGEGWFNLGLSHLFSENLTAAQQAFARSAELLPNNWEAFNRLGYVYETQKQYQAALDSYRKALELHQDSTIEESVERIQERIRRQREGLG